MATYTIVDTKNIDELNGRVGGDVYNINGGLLTIDQDSRFGLSSSATASLGNVTLSSTLGGTMSIDGRYVRLITYTSGSGIVPVPNTLITKGNGSGSTASGKLIGVWANLTSSATTTGAAMPASGYIKIKQWNSIEYISGTVSGITASAAAASVPGWIEVVGDEAATITVSRLGTFQMRGEWYQVGTSSGVTSSTYQIPTNGNVLYLAGTWVETATASNNFEFYACAGSLVASGSIATDAIRGKVCWISTAGLLRFGSDGTNNNGYVPTPGCIIKIPNIITANCTASRSTNALPNATLATRYDFTTTGAGVIDIDKANLAWYPSFAQPYSVKLTNVGILTQLSVSEIASPITWSQVGVGQEAANAQFALLMSLCFAGGSASNCVWSRASLAGASTYVNSLTDVSNIDFYDDISFSFLARANATTGNNTLTRVANCDWIRPVIGTGRVLITTCTNLNYTNTVYHDLPFGTTTTTNPMYAFDLASNTINITIDGLSFGGLTLTQPYSGILNVGAAGCANIKLRNLGTYASPLDLGGARLNGITYSRVTTVATANITNHGLKVNDIFYAIVSSDVAAVTVATKTVATVPTVNSITFTCLNAGAATGTFSFYPTMSANLFVLAAGAAANTIKVQRCYTPHTRTNLFTTDNSSKNIYIDNVYGDYINAPVLPQLNGTLRGVGVTAPLTAQTSCYGTHWFDNFTTDNSPNIATQSWTRTTTTAFITSTSHILRTGDIIIVNISSDTAAIVLGQKTITVLNTNLFTFVCLNAGGASGTLSFVVCSGRIGIQMNESTSDTSNQYTLTNGSAFTSAGSLYMPVIGQEAIFETPNYIIGHGGFPIADAVMAGGTIGNYDIKYLIDKNDGNGYGNTYSNLYYNRTNGSGVSAQATFSATSSVGVSIGDYVWGTGIAPNAKVTATSSFNIITVDKNNTATVSGTIRFNHLPAESSIDPQKGIKMKVYIKTFLTNATAITSLYAFTTNSTITRAYQYDLDNPINFGINIIDKDGNTITSPTEVTIVRSSDTTILYNVESIITGSATYSYQYTSNITAYINVLNVDSYESKTVDPIILSNVDQTITVQLDDERGKYNNP